MADDLPKFDALREYIDQTLVTNLKPLTYGHLNLQELMTPVGAWIDKLEEWSKARLKDLEEVQRQRESFERAALESEDMTDAYASLVEALQDLDRGIRDWREVQDLLPDSLGTYQGGDPWQDDRS